jgi:hypothetical protein
VRVYAELTNSDIYVRKTQTSAKRSKVQKIEGTGGKVNTYNLMAREFVANGGDKETATGIQSSATAVIHLIDSPIE